MSGAGDGRYYVSSNGWAGESRIWRFSVDNEFKFEFTSYDADSAMALIEGIEIWKKKQYD